MKAFRPIVLAAVLAAAAVIAGCSTTRRLHEGQYRLVKNNIVINGNSDLKPSALTQYVKQQANSTVLFGWSPGLSIYNWSDGSGKGLNYIWDKLGTAPVIFNQSLVESSKENIAKHLEYLGYYGSTVDAEIEKKDKKAYVKYTVTPGKRYVIDAIKFTIPDNPEFAGFFYADTAAHLVKRGSYLSEELLEKESARGAAVIRNLGYYDFSKSNYFFIADTLKPGWTGLDYSVRGYSRNESAASESTLSRYRFGEVTISHAADIKFRENVLRRLNLIHPGDYYSEDIVNTTYNRLASIKVFNGVSVQLSPADSAVVDCNIRLSDSKLQGIKVNGELSYSSSGLIGVSPQLSWYHKNIFHGGEWLSLGFTGNFQFRPSDKVRATEFGVTSSLSLPRFLGLPYTVFTGSSIPRTEFKAAYNYQNRPEYTRQRTTLSYGYSWQTGRYYHFQLFPLRATHINLSDTSPEFEKTLARNPFIRDSYRSHMDAGLNASVYHSTSNELVPAVPYHYERFSIDLSGNFVSLFKKLMKQDEAGQYMLFGAPYTQYVRGELILGRTFRFGFDNRQQLATRIDVGAGHAYGNSTSLPFEEQFYCGGANSMRGWQARTLGPGSKTADGSFIIPSQTGDLKLEIDLEYRFPIVWKLEGAIFAEAGNVWYIADLDKDFLSTVAGDWGLGLRVNLNFIVARLDLGIKEYDPSKAAGTRWSTPRQWFTPSAMALHFGVGYPF